MKLIKKDYRSISNVPENESAKKVQISINPNSWGRQEYKGNLYKKRIKKNVGSDSKIYYSRVNRFMDKIVGKIHNKKEKYISYEK